MEVFHLGSGRGIKSSLVQSLSNDRLTKRAPPCLLACHKAGGFTLIEMMVTIVVLSILASIAIPNFISMVRSNRISSEANSLLTTVTLGRSEAIKRNAQVTLCKSSDGASCSTASGVNWNQGIIIFVDSNSNGSVDSGETVIRADSPFSKLDTITFSNGNTLVYQPNGVITATATVTFTTTSGPVSKVMEITPIGRARIR